MNSHNSEISNGQYNSAISETTIKTFCNDNEGFAIYTIGYADNEDGKNVLTDSTLGNTYDIETSTKITGNISLFHHTSHRKRVPFVPRPIRRHPVR